MEINNRDTVFLGYSVGESSVSSFFTKLAVVLSTNVDVIIFSDKRNPFPITLKNITLLYWPSARPTKRVDFLFLKSKIHLHKPKLLLSTFGSNNLFALAGFIMKVPFRVATHRSISSHFKSSTYKRARKRFVFKLNTHIIANSEATKQDLISTFSVSEKKVAVIYNAVPKPNVLKRTIPNKIVYVGRLTENKGISVLLKAFKIVLKSHTKLQLYLLRGSNDEVFNYRNLANSYGIDINCHFLGNQPKKSVLKNMSEAMFVVVPSISEAFGFVVIESFSVKTPVIGSDTGGIKEIIRNKKEGILFPVCKENALAEEILSLSINGGEQERMGNNAYNRFLDTFELETVVNSFATYLLKIINS